MRRGAANPIVNENNKVSRVLFAITRARAGSATVVDKKGKLKGIFTDGDLRRHLESDKNLPGRRICEVMTKNPTVVNKDMLAAQAVRILQAKRIDEIPVVDKNMRPVGLLDVQDLLKAGLV
jgi:arabinose-5-phosphate isomerase